MSYRQKTPHFNIPVVGFGDRISPDQELRKYTIIENMLIAGTQGLTEVVFDDGDYHLDKDGESYTVNVRAGGTYPSIHGIVGGFYFRAPPKVVWSGLKPNRLYYLYIRGTVSMPHQNSDVRAVSSTYALGKGALLVAMVDLREETPFVESNPDGKVYSQDVARHASDTSNPHGRRLEQDELVIKNVLALGEDAQIEVAGSLIPIATFAETVASLAGRRTEVIDFESGGTAGAVVRASSKVFSVQVHRRVSEAFDDSVGEIGIGYHGEDETADEEQEFVVYNTGAEGIPMRALVVCG
jgi:hypothetical protein